MGFRRNNMLAFAGMAAVVGMAAGIDRGGFIPTIPSPPVISQPKRDDRRKKKGPAPKPMDRKHLNPQSAFMRQIAEERAIGIHPKYRHSVARSYGPTAEAWENCQRAWREKNWKEAA
jgi:hypothetical protein